MVRENRMQAWLLWLWSHVWRRHNIPDMRHVIVEWVVWRWQVIFEVTSGAYKWLFYPTNHVSFLLSPLDVSEWGRVMWRLSQGHHWLGKWLADIIKPEDVAACGGVYIGMLSGYGADHCQSAWVKGKCIQCILTAWRQGFQTGNKKTEASYVHSE